MPRALDYLVRRPDADPNRVDASGYSGGGSLTPGQSNNVNDLGMLIDVARASDEAILQAVSASRQPVIYSHGGFRAIVNHPRCITDEAAKPLAAKGGVIGIQFGSSINNPKYAEWARQRGTPPRSASGVQKRPLFIFSGSGSGGC